MLFRSGKGSILVEVQSEEDGSLLIGKEGRNLKAFEALMNCAVLGDAKSPSLSLDIEGYRGRGSGTSRNDARDDRGPRRGRDDRGPRRDRDDRGRRPRREGDAERDQAITAEASTAIEKVLSGEESGIVLSEMNSYERHLAHTVVKDAEGVGSRSVGSGSDRRVEVFAE